MAAEIILKQLLIFGILSSIGAIAFWRKVITPEIRNNLSRIVIDLTLPFLIFTTFAGMELSLRLLTNGLIVFLLSFLNIFLLYMLGSASSRVLRLKGSSETIHTLHTMFGNIVFLAFPLLDALFPGGVGIFYGAMYQLASNIITFTYGVYRLSNRAHGVGWRNIFNLNTIALAFGTVFLLSGLPLPPSVRIAFEGVGRCTGPLSMVFIGALLAGLNFRKAIFQKSAYLLSFNKLILAPLLLASFYYYGLKSISIEMDPTAFKVLILQVAMPCQTIVVVLSQRYHSNSEMATSNLFITTLLSVISLPLIYFFLNWLMA